MPSIWNTHYGYIRNDNDAAIVIGEWGGYMTGSDLEWMNRYSEYLVDKSIGDNFFWCLNSDSGDTGGLLDNWTEPDQPRLNLTKVIQPNPTTVTKSDDGNICVKF